MKNLSSAVTDEQIEKILSFDATDYGNALTIDLLHGDKFLHVEEWGLLYYNGQYWQRDHAEKHLYTCAINMMKVRGKLALEHEKEALQKCTGTDNRKVNGAIAAFQNLTTRAASVDEFDSVPHLINVANGVLDLRTGELTEHNPAHKFTYITPIAYNKNADSSVWENFLQTVVMDYSQEEIKNYLQMAVGYSLTGSMREEKLFYLYGPTRSGKGTFLMVLGELLGNKLAGATRFNTFTKKRDGSDQGFDLAPLHSCRFVAASESDGNERMNEAMVKTMTGRDKLSASYKGKDHFDFYPQWKIWLSSNYKPKGSVTDNAFWNRLSLIIFPNSFEGTEDKNLKDTLTTEDVLQGALLWAVKGARKWFDNANGLVTPQVYNDALDDARNELDSVARWMEDNCNVDKGNSEVYAPSKALYNDYIQWCEGEGDAEAWKEKTFYNYLSERGFGRGKAYFETGVKIDGKMAKKQLRTFIGLTISESNGKYFI